MTTPLPFSWPYLLVFWAIYIWVFITEYKAVLRSTSNEPIQAADRGSRYVIAVGFNVAMLAAFSIPFVFRWATLPGNQFVWFFIGIFVLITGSLLRRHCFKVLGHFFEGAVKIQADHRVIDSGAYRWVRHPSYSGAFLILLGVALAQGNWLSVIVTLIIAIPTYTYRAHVEEQALLSSLGTTYADFIASRKRFIPFIF